MRLSKLRTDPALEKSGAWVTWAGDVRFRVRRIGNIEYRRAIAEGLKPHRLLIRAGALPDATMEAIERKAFATHVLVGWSGLEDDEDRPVEYTPEQAQKILADPRYHDLYEFVAAAAARMENFRVEDKVEDLGNSRSSSNGRASSDRSRSSSELSPDRAPASGARSQPSTRNRKSTKRSARSGARSPSSTTPNTE